VSDFGPRRQREVYLAGLAGRRPKVPVAPDRLEAAARRAMTPEAFAYVAGGAGREGTVDANRAALDGARLLPRVLRDASARDLTTTLFGARLAAPLLLAPIGVLEMAHREADLAVARAAAAEGVPFVFSSQASVPMEACAEAMERVAPGAPRLFQLYWSKDDALVRSFVRRAEGCGCRAIVLTLDTTLLGWRPRDLDLGSLPFLHGKGIAQYTSDPVFRSRLGEPLPDAPTAKARVTPSSLRAFAGMMRRYPGRLGEKLRSGAPRAAVQRFVATYSRPSLTWDDLAFLRDLTTLPLVLKGVLHPDDAARAVEAGMDGVWVSNHGGRQVDGAVGALDALPGAVAAVGGRVPVVFDSGVRGGADGLKAPETEAVAVGLGRPYVYGLALAGEEGVREVIRNVVAELDLTLGLVGCPSVAAVDPDVLAGNATG